MLTNMSASHERTIESVVEFTEVVCVDSSRDNLLFRGQARAWPLVPRLASVKLRDRNLAECERQMMARFKRWAMPHLDVTPSTEWDWLALAQHHGMPTRLLDWSSNPLAALWFAVNRPADGTDHAVVWGFSYHDSEVACSATQDPYDPAQGIMVFQPRVVSARIAAQSGYFTVHPHSSEPPAVPGRWVQGFVPFEDDPRYSERLLKINVPASSFSLIRYHLDLLGVHAMALFPDLDGVCRHVRWSSTCESDENGPMSGGAEVHFGRAVRDPTKDATGPAR